MELPIYKVHGRVYDDFKTVKKDLLHVALSCTFWRFIILRFFPVI
jgi:hypothetical protein